MRKFGGLSLKTKSSSRVKKKMSITTNWLAMGACFECGDEVIDYGFVENFILNLEAKYGVEIVQIGYDRYNAISTIQKLEAAGYECVEIKQHSSVLHPPTKLLKELILKKCFQYDENLMLEINFQNARCTEDTNLNKYVNKKTFCW
jgi:phage terminase large subunit-like protein